MYDGATARPSGVRFGLMRPITFISSADRVSTEFLFLAWMTVKTEQMTMEGR